MSILPAVEGLDKTIVTPDGPEAASTMCGAQNSAFEGPEKLLEIWFAQCADAVPDAKSPVNGKTGLRKIERKIWEDMLDIVKCKVLSVVEGAEMDAYLLSESSLFVSPHRVILKTCGTTLNLLGLPRILEIAALYANMHTVYRCFYSRKSFMFPDRQIGPHRDWKYEVEFLDNIFPNGSAYTVGKVNGDHWLLYLTSPVDDEPSSPEGDAALPATSSDLPDCTIEILMSDLSPSARQSFFPSSPAEDPSAHASSLSQDLGITDIFPSRLTTLDAYSFSPCGYSSNALINWGQDPALTHKPDSGEGYYTIHVTPEDGWSYASFECNVPLPPFRAKGASSDLVPDLQTLIQRVVRIFQPGRLSLTLFVSSEDNETENGEESPIEAAQRAFRTALTASKGAVNGNVGASVYKRTDKINYEFGGYDLAFASFEEVK